MSNNRSLMRTVCTRMAKGGVIAAAAMLPLLAYASSYPTVTTQRLDDAQHGNGWLMYRGNYSGNGYSLLDKINTSNVSGLKVAWTYKSDLTQGFEAPPVVNGDWMYATTPMDHLIALDAKTGAVRWKYVFPINKKALKTVCCDVVNRGVALYGDSVYMETLDNHVVALNAKTGKVEWKRQLWAPGVGYFMTAAPLVVKGKIIVGTGGGEYGARGFITALNAKTGKIEWQFHTTAAPGTPGGNTWPKGAYKTGGGNPWLTGTYDPETNTLFWGVGNPGPWLATLRPGDNLYTDSVLALNPSNGKLKWYYQYTPNDTWDYDGVNTPVMADISYQGKDYKALIHADRNGYLYAINRENGKLIYAKPFVNATSLTGPNAEGVMQSNPAKRYKVGEKVFTCPSFLGGKNWWPISVDPQTQMVYIPTEHACMTISGVKPVAYKAGLAFLDASFEVLPDPESPDKFGSFQGVNLSTGEQAWQFPTHLPWTGGALSTAGGVTFSGYAGRHFYAFDAKTGKVLWDSGELSSGIVGVPSTYEVDGKQYVAIWAGWGGASPIWGGKMANDPAMKAIPRGGQLYVFALQ